MQLIFPTSGRAEILGQPVGDVAVAPAHRLPARNPVLLRLPDRRGAARRTSRSSSAIGRCRAEGARVARCSIASASGRSAGCSCASSRKAWCSASASRRRSSTIPRSSSSTSRCPASIRSAGATSATLILELRDQGRTVFFSSHILSDAEALCSRVAIVAGGRLAAAGRLSDILAFDVRGWELVVDGVDAATCTRRSARSPADRPRSAPGRYALELLARPAAGEAARGSRGDRRAASCRSIRSRHARGLLRPARRRRWEPGRAPRVRRTSRARPLAAIAVNVFRESVRDRVLYNLVLFAVLLIASSLPARPADGRAGRQDHQGPRAGGDVGLRPVHRHLHRHRPGVERSRAAQHLRAAREADQPHAVRPRQVRRAGADAGRQRRGHDRSRSTSCWRT